MDFDLHVAGLEKSIDRGGIEPAPNCLVVKHLERIQIAKLEPNFELAHPKSKICRLNFGFEKVSVLFLAAKKRGLDFGF